MEVNVDTVWIRLNVVTLISTPTLAVDDYNEEYFMFGPTGIVRFKRIKQITLLFNSAKVLIAEVSEDPDYIMDVLSKVRKTEGALDEHPKKKIEPNKSRETSTKASKSKTNN
jgi:TATA-box binding protein (TBP) (component of TFIID and TFIIIB)